jgi:hypothetical protein
MPTIRGLSYAGNEATPASRYAGDERRYSVKFDRERLES